MMKARRRLGNEEPLSRQTGEPLLLVSKCFCSASEQSRYSKSSEFSSLLSAPGSDELGTKVPLYQGVAWEPDDS